MSRGRVGLGVVLGMVVCVQGSFVSRGCVCPGVMCPQADPLFPEADNTPPDQRQTPLTSPSDPKVEPPLPVNRMTDRCKNITLPH